MSFNDFRFKLYNINKTSVLASNMATVATAVTANVYS